MNGGEQTDALRETYRKELMMSLFFDIPQRAGDTFGGPSVGRTAPPVWAKGTTRVGRYEKLGQIAESPTGYRKSIATLSGMSPGTSQPYLRGWGHRAQYCHLRGEEHCETVWNPGWGE